MADQKKLLYFPEVVKRYDGVKEGCYVDNLGFPINVTPFHDSCDLRVRPNMTLITYWGKNDRQYQMMYDRRIKSSI